MGLIEELTRPGTLAQAICFGLACWFFWNRGFKSGEEKERWKDGTN